MGSVAVYEKKGVMRLKAWCVPVNFPNPEEQPEQAEAARKFIQMFKGMHGLCPQKNGMVLLVFTEKEDARAAKWKLEEFADFRLPIIEGIVSEDGQKLSCRKVLND